MSLHEMPINTCTSRSDNGRISNNFSYNSLNSEIDLGT